MFQARRYLFSLVSVAVSFSFTLACRQGSLEAPRSGLDALPTELHAGGWIGSEHPEDSPEAPYGPIPVADTEPSLIISRPQYMLSWNHETRILNWGSWVLTTEDVGHVNRSSQFYRDVELDQVLATQGKRAVLTEEYSGSCFDRGHQVPSKDRSDTTEDNNATFIMSNIMPQTAFLNRVIWERLEAHSRYLLLERRGRRLWILTGPIFLPGPRKFIGPDKNIAVPDANFKIVVDLGKNSRSQPELVTAVVMPNVTSQGTNPVQDRSTTCDDQRGTSLTQVGVMSNDWKHYAVGLNEIEERAHIDLGRLKAELP